MQYEHKLGLYITILWPFHAHVTAQITNRTGFTNIPIGIQTPGSSSTVTLMLEHDGAPQTQIGQYKHEEHPHW